MSSWQVERRADTWLPTSGAEMQWDVRASFAGFPSGGSTTHGSAGHFNAHEVGADDELYSLTIEPRFK
jgi:hypothetical protein